MAAAAAGPVGAEWVMMCKEEEDFPTSGTFLTLGGSGTLGPDWSARVWHVAATTAMRVWS